MNQNDLDPMERQIMQNCEIALEKLQSNDQVRHDPDQPCDLCKKRVTALITLGSRWICSGCHDYFYYLRAFYPSDEATIKRIEGDFEELAK